MKEYSIWFVVLSFMVGGGFYLGKSSYETPYCPEKLSDPIELPEPTTIHLLSIEQDRLRFSLQGSGQVLVDSHLAIADSGEHQISLGKIPTENDLSLREFPYVGNEKTQKFYNADSYHARGTEVKHRRFFQTVKEAGEAGFVASKTLK